jgi:hypothetical protein
LSPAKGREVYAAILSLAIEPRPWRALQLAGEQGYGLRVGTDWVLYRIDDEHRVVRILKIGGLDRPPSRKRP